MLQQNQFSSAYVKTLFTASISSKWDAKYPDLMQAIRGGNKERKYGVSDGGRGRRFNIEGTALNIDLLLPNHHPDGRLKINLKVSIAGHEEKSF